jgi:hypothetical protein
VHLIVHDFGGPWGVAWTRIWRTPVLGELFTAMITRSGFRASVRREQRGNRRPIRPQIVERWYEHCDHGTRNAILRLYRATDPSALGYAQAKALRHPTGRSLSPGASATGTCARDTPPMQLS